MPETVTAAALAAEVERQAMMIYHLFEHRGPFYGDPPCPEFRCRDTRAMLTKWWAEQLKEQNV